MIYAYCVSLSDSEKISSLPDQQIDQYIIEKTIGRSRRMLRELRQQLRTGDRIIVADLVSFGLRSKQLLQFISDLSLRGISVCAIKEDFDTQQPLGRQYLQFWQQLSNLDHTVHCALTRDGQTAAKQQGRAVGRRRVPKLQLEQAIHLYYDQAMPITQICRQCGISKSTLYNYLSKTKKGGY